MLNFKEKANIFFQSIAFVKKQLYLHYQIQIHILVS